MASVYTRPGSPFLWIKRRDPITGKIVRESTGLRAGAPGSKQEANAIAAEYRRREAASPTRPARGERWTAWAADYFEKRYAGKGEQLRTARIALRELLVFFAAKQVYTPRMLSYVIAGQWLEWRLSGDELPKVHHNTAMLRWVYLGVLCGEALRRGFCDVNVCRSVRFSRVPAKEKEEISLEDQAKIEAALAVGKQWMREQFLVLMKTGCRLRETYVPLERITAGTITFRLKGGKFHTTNLHPDLRPLVALARAEKRPTLVVGDPSPSAVWANFFRKLKMPYSAHCTRVTVITRLLRAGHSPALVCTLIGHSEEVNVIYRRLKPADVVALQSAL